jgi:DNA polymerase-3 subunit epsilon
MKKMYFAIDTETTGFKDSRPIEIAAVCIDNYSINFCEKINTNVDIEEGAQKVHGISKDDLKHCRDEKDVLIDILHFLIKNNATVLIAHNVSFDRKILSDACERHHLKMPQVEWECTLLKSRSLYPTLKHKLSDCCKRAGIEYKDSHSSLPDAIMCAEVFKSFFKPTKEDLEYDEGLRLVNEEDYLWANQLFPVL